MWLFTIGDIFARARAHQALTPAERAFLRMVDGLIIFIALTVLTAVTPMLKGDTPFTLNGLIHITFLALAQALGMAVMKLWKAQGDNGVGLTDPAAPAAAPTTVTAPSSGESVALPPLAPMTGLSVPLSVAPHTAMLRPALAGDPGATQIVPNPSLTSQYVPPTWLTGAVWEAHLPSLAADAATSATADAPQSQADQAPYRAPDMTQAATVHVPTVLAPVSSASEGVA